MKIDPREPIRDRCQTSIEMLVRACREWFAARNIDHSTVWFADDDQPFPPGTGVLNVVLFGGYLRRFFESGNWPARPIRIWVLSEAVHAVLVTLLGVPPECVGRIPREDLWPAKETDFMSQRQPLSLVFAGRVSATKNVDPLLRTVSALQIEHDFPVGLHLCGDFDDESHPDQGRRAKAENKKHLLNLAHELKWKIPPYWHPKTGPEEWLDHGFENPTFMSLSTYVNDDFGVAVAQARGAGWPCWLSDWGGHREVHGDEVRKIPSILIPSSHEPPPLIAFKARALAAHLSRPFHKSASTQYTPTRDGGAQPLEIDKWDEIRRAALSRWGPDIHRLYREGSAAFADTPVGTRFYSELRRLFAGPARPNRPWVILVNDLHESESPLLQGLSDICENWLQGARREKRDLVFLTTRQMRDPLAAPDLIAAEKIIVPFKAPDFADNLRQCLATTVIEGEP